MYCFIITLDYYKIKKRKLQKKIQKIELIKIL